MPEGIDLGISGLASGFDWRGLVDQLIEVERAPQRRMFSEQQAILARKAAYDSVNTQLSVLQNRVEDLNDSALFESRLGRSSDEEVATAAAEAGAAIGSYEFDITQLATTAVQRGTSNIGSPLSTTTDVSAVTLSSAGFATAVTAGTFTINGKQITIATTDTLQGVFDKISTATGGDVVGTYNPLTDGITLTSSTTNVVLGSATDTSNFLQVTRLSNNGSAAVSSSSALGAAKLSGALSSANLGTTINDGGSVGLFKINGVEIAFDDGTDSISDILTRINDSTAGVTAGYDAVNDRFILTNKVTGDLGFALEDVSGNFLAATGLSVGTLQRGDDLLYTVNGGGRLSSHSNTITEESSGIEGLSVAVIADGSTTVAVASDTGTIKGAITDFVEAYNKTQALIETSTASTTDAKGKVTAGTLAGESEAFTIASDLRRLVTSTFSSLTGTIKRLESMGITSNGSDDKLAISDADALEAALSDNLSQVKSLFTNATDGLAADLAAFLEGTVGDDGTLLTKKDNLDKQAEGLTDQITEQERQVQLNRTRLISTFVQMETAQQKINSQLQYLSKINAG
jgi:flagellar hook-associated protein 2